MTRVDDDGYKNPFEDYADEFLPPPEERAKRDNVVPLRDDPFPPMDAYADEMGGEQFREMTDKEKDAIPALEFKPWGHRDLAAIPAPEFVYSDFYARGYTSVTLAPPKVGKSMLGLAEAIDMASGRGFLSGEERAPQRVFYYNAEDDQSVIDARVAALLGHYGIRQEEIAETLIPVSGVEAENFYMVTGQDGQINERLFIGLEKFIDVQRIDALIFDPLQDLSTSPETNEVFRVLGQRIRRMASSKRVAVGLIHHTRKIAPGAQASIDDGRGGSALRGTSRFNRLLISMTEDEAVKAGLDNHRRFMRIADMESNLAPPSADVNRWFQKLSVEIPNGHKVGAIEPWRWPDAFEGITPRQTADCQALLLDRATPARANVQASDWVGNLIAPVLHLDPSNKSDRARLGAIVKKWIQEDVLRADTEIRAKDGREMPVVIVGSNRVSGG